MSLRILTLLLVLLCPMPVRAAEPPARNFTVEEVMVPMRDGTRLYTLIVVPNAAKNAPILLTRTPFFAEARKVKPDAIHVGDFLPSPDRPFVEDGYIRVYQDVRGRARSEGDYWVTRPPRGPINRTGVDHATDAADTIDWLLKHLPQTNGRVGMIGSSYEGLTVVMALLDPHPALKAAAPLNPMIDGWMGDDWFHHGAFRLSTLDFIAFAQGSETADAVLHPDPGDDYETFLKAGSASGMAASAGLDRHAFWRAVSDHPAYDAGWRGQALDRLLAAHPPSVPTIWAGALWDQEDAYGAVHGYQAMEAADRANNRNFLVLGPWRHGGMLGDGSRLGLLEFGEDTAAYFRNRVLKPFLDARLKTGAAPADIPPVLAFQTGANRWVAADRWPAKGVQRRYYLGAAGSLRDHAPTAPGADRYLSDPASPVPYAPRPIHGNDPDAWRTWLVVDQRFTDGRPDQLGYLGAPVTAPLVLAGLPSVDLYAATTGTDADWVVKLIDVYPDTPDTPPALRGHHLILSADIFRGRYAKGFDKARPLPAGKTVHYAFTLPAVNHVLQPGHRLMVQIQSSWFPLFDRNPQTFVPNIFFAKPEDYRAATQTIVRSPSQPTSITLTTAE